MDVIRKYQKAQKLVSTYGLDFLNHILPTTNRIHTNYTQIKSTGRMASGNEKENKKQEVGVLNL